MICEEELVDLRIADPKSIEEGTRLAQLAFRLNHTMPMTDEYQEILKELFGDNLGEGSHINAPIQGVCFDRIKIGKKSRLAYGVCSWYNIVKNESEFLLCQTAANHVKRPLGTIYPSRPIHRSFCKCTM